MPTQEELEARYNFDALAGADDRTWQLARQFARTNPTIAATIREVNKAYGTLAVDAAQRAAEPDDVTARRDAKNAQVAAQLQRRGFTPDSAA